MLWWEWWAGLQPAWRECDDRGIPVIGGSGDWNALRAPGKNGLLIVLLSLAWWREAATNATMQRWTAALADVAWVIQSMAAQALQDKELSARAISSSWAN